MNRFINLILLLLLPSAAILATAQDCYYPDGQIPTDYVYTPCNGSSAVSCCVPSTGDICLSNGLCFWPGGPYPYRGACTDRDWTSDTCPRFCMGDDPTTWERLYVCGGNKYCCGADCCSDPANTFFIAPASVINSFGQTGYSIPAELMATTSPTSSASPTGTNTGSASTTDTSKNLATAVGAGLGVGLLIAVIVAFFCYRYFHRKHFPSAARLPEAQTTYPPPFQPPHSTSPPPQQYQQTSMYPPWPTNASPYPYHMEQKPAGLYKQIPEQAPVEMDSTPSRGPAGGWGGATELDATPATERKVWRL